MMARILVPVDFSSCSWAALDQAFEVATRTSATMVLLHVWKPPQHVLPEMVIFFPGNQEQSLSDYAMAEAGKEMERFLAALSPERRQLVRTKIVLGQPVTSILEEAQSGAYDMVVMGTHGRRGLSHFFLGSVAEQVVRRAACPVLTVRGPKGPPKAAQAVAQQ